MVRPSTPWTLFLLAGCILDTALERASVGGPFSPPRVVATVNKHFEAIPAWGTSTTYALDVEVAGQPFHASLPGSCDEVRIAPGRTMVAARCERQWLLYSFQPAPTDGGVGELARDGTPLAELSWPDGASRPLPDDSWLGWTLGAVGLAAAAVLLLKVPRVRRFFTT